MMDGDVPEWLATLQSTMTKELKISSLLPEAMTPPNTRKDDDPSQAKVFVTWSLTEATHELLQEALATQRAKLYISGHLDDFKVDTIWRAYNPIMLDASGYGLQIGEALYDLFQLPSLQNVAAAMQFQSSCPTYKFNIIPEKGKLGPLLSYLRSEVHALEHKHPLTRPRMIADQLEQFSIDYAGLNDDNITCKADWDIFLSNHGLPEAWKSMLNVNIVLRMFGCTGHLAQELAKTHACASEEEDDVTRPKTFETICLTWLCRAIQSFKVHGEFKHLINLIYAMMRQDETSQSHTELQTLEIIIQFKKQLIENPNTLWIPEIIGYHDNDKMELCQIIMKHVSADETRWIRADPR